MKMKPWPIAAILSILILTGASCKRTSQTAQSGQPTTAGGPPEQYHEGGGTVAAGEVKYFKGSIGSTLGLQMRLTREGDNLTGNYFYRKIGTKIDLKGTVAKDGTVVLQEFDTNGQQTGLFKGIWKPGEDGLIGISGEWSKTDGGKKKTAFSLHEEPIEFTAGVEIVAKQIKESNKQAKYEVTAEYPQLSNSLNANFEKFNKEAKSLVLRKVNDFKKQAAETEPVEGVTTGSSIDIGYTVNLAKDDLISVEFDVGDFYSGAAHGNSYSEVVNFDLKNGKPLKLEDLFKPGSKYLQTISTYCISDLKKQVKNNSLFDAESIEEGAAANSKNYQSWTITRKGIGVNFDPYQVGPYAAGPQFVMVSYSVLKDLIKPDGPIAQFVK